MTFIRDVIIIELVFCFLMRHNELLLILLLRNVFATWCLRALCYGLGSGTQSIEVHQSFTWFQPEEHLGLVSGHIRHWIKKAFHYFALAKGRRKFHCQFNVKLHGTNDDHELMARYNARREASGMAEYDCSVSRLCKAVQEALVKRSHDE